MNSRNEQKETLESLARRVAQGDARARLAFADALGPQLARIVRRALERGEASLDMMRRIVFEARRLSSTDPVSIRPSFPGQARAERERLTERVTDNLSQAILSRLWGPTELVGLSATAVA